MNENHCPRCGISFVTDTGLGMNFIEIRKWDEVVAHECENCDYREWVVDLAVCLFPALQEKANEDKR